MSVRDDFATALVSLRSINGIMRWEHEHDRIMANQMLDIAVADLHQAEWFIFPDGLPPAAITREWNNILPAIEAELIDLPFPRCCFAIRLVTEGGMEGANVLLVSKADDGARWHIAAFTGPDFANVNPSVVLTSYMVDGRLFWNDRQMEWFATASTMFAGTCVHALLGAAMSILITPQVKRDKVTYKPKQQRLRAERGLPASPVTYIHTREWVDALLETQRREATGGTHASPRPHLRRGHIRTLQDSRRIWINPMIVGASDQHGVVKRDHYVVKANTPIPA